ncbi:MAG: hypothetical protein LBO77_01880 [Desulfovibrio sp.]|jgi:hypothetical protein|nr:hypothetical protein [Desulfovibrio sp.]
MEIPAVFSIPLFLRDPEDLPEGIALFRTGLEQEPPSAGLAAAAEAAFAARLPLAPAEARAVLAEMLSLGQDHAGALLRLAAPDFRPARKDAIREEEAAGLEAFARSGRLDPSPPDMRKALLDSHKILLLAWSLERTLAEARELKAKLRRGEEGLRAVLGGGEGGIYAPPEAPDPGDLPPWRIVLDAALAFVPDKALLFSDDVRVRRDLWAAGMLRPLPGDLAACWRHWPEKLLTGLLLASLPAWRLVGRSFLPADRPWLAREAEMLVVRPGAGRREDGPELRGLGG